MKKKFEWTQEKISLLKAIYPKFLHKEVAKMLNCSVGVVRYKAVELGLTVTTAALKRNSKYIQWTQEMIDLLIKEFPVKKNIFVADHLGISLSAMHRKVKELGLKKSESFYLSNNLKRDWTPDKLEVLKRDYPVKLTALLCKEFGVSRRCLERKARLMGISKVDNFREINAELLSRRIKTGQAISPKKGNITKNWFKKGRVATGKPYQKGTIIADIIGPEKEKERISKSVMNRKKTFIMEKYRVEHGIPQKTKLRVTRQPTSKVSQKYTLKKCGYTFSQDGTIAYWDSNTKRCPIIEKKHRWYRFMEKEDEKTPAN